jgi:general secretion pathway protein A
MYTAFYGLREKPFALSPDPRFLFLAESHREALAHLLYGIEQGEGFIAITGEVGTGKTTLCRTLLQRLGAESEVAFLFNPKLSALELMQAVHAEFGLDAAGRSWRELVDQLNEFLLERKREGKRVLVIIDEAQNLETDTLEQVRLLSNLETDTAKLLQIVLLGQPELDAKLERPELRQLKQRISVRWRLVPLTATETREYVRHRLRIASGSERELFTETALREVHRRSGGIPRVVNVLCDRALLLGYASRAATIGSQLVVAVAQELQSGGPGAPKPAPARSRRWLLPVGGLVVAGGLLALGLGVYDGVRSLGEAPSAAPSSPAAVAPAEATVAPAASEGPALPSDTPPAAQVPLPDPSGPVAPSDGVPATAPATPAAGTPPVATAPPPGAAAAAQPADVVARLETLPPGRTAAASVDALLAAYGLQPVGAASLSLDDALAALGDAGLETLPLAAPSLTELGSLDHPALLALLAPDGAQRTVALLGLQDGRATLAGVGGPGPMQMPASELERRWQGEAFVVWRDWERLPALLQEGETGPGVRWLQQSLIDLGYLVGTPTGVFDAATREGVRNFQRGSGLEVDGSVGPRTKMRLYDALGRYRVPRLRGEGVG